MRSNSSQSPVQKHETIYDRNIFFKSYTFIREHLLANFVYKYILRVTKVLKYYLIKLYLVFQIAGFRRSELATNV